MRILFLTAHLNQGGITTYLKTLGAELVEQGHAVYVVSSGGELSDVFEQAGMQLITVDLNTKFFLSPKVGRAVRKLIDWVKTEKIDIIHAHKRVPQTVAYFVSKDTGVPYVSTLHGFHKVRLSRRLFPCWGQRVIAISQAVAKHLHQDFSVPMEKINIVRTGIDLSIFKPVEEKQPIAGKPEDIIIACVGRFSAEKGQAGLLDVFAKLHQRHPHAHLLLLGAGREKKHLQEKIQQLEIEHRVTLLSPDRYKNTDVYAAADIYVQPSLQEGLGISVMEAQAMALPVVASGAGGLEELILPDQTGFNYQQDDALLLAYLSKLVVSSELRARVGAEAGQYAHIVYSIELMAKKVLAVYTKFSF
jgi:glycosyltransferase involved in cell wall biosynthesis